MISSASVIAWLPKRCVHLSFNGRLRALLSSQSLKKWTMRQLLWSNIPNIFPALLVPWQHGEVWVSAKRREGTDSVEGKAVTPPGKGSRPWVHSRAAHHSCEKSQHSHGFCHQNDLLWFLQQVWHGNWGQLPPQSIPKWRMQDFLEKMAVIHWSRNNETIYLECWANATAVANLRVKCVYNLQFPRTEDFLRLARWYA